LKACITFIFWVDNYNARGNKGKQREKQTTQSGAVDIQEMLTLNRAKTVFLVQHGHKNVGEHIFTSKNQMYAELNILARNKPTS